MVDRGGRKHARHRQSVMEQYEGVCHLCGGPYADAIDHVIPVARGGSDHPDNLRPAHTKCNSTKRDSLPADWESMPATCWIGEKGRTPSPEEIRQHVLRDEEQRKRERAQKQRERSDQRAAERREAIEASRRAERARIGAEVRRLEAERLNARQQMAKLESEPQRRVPVWGYFPWLLPIGIFFVVDYSWGRVPAWWMTVLSIPIIALPIFMRLNRTVLAEKEERRRAERDLAQADLSTSLAIHRQQQDLKRRYPGRRNYRSYRRSYRRW